MTKELLDIDKQHIWHPYASATSAQQSLIVESAKGVFLKLTDGSELIDGMSSWWSVIHGYNHAELNAAIEKQLKKMAHVMFGGITHEPAIKLTKQLIEILPIGLEHVFYSDSGSVSVEVAMKMALQYWYAKGCKNKDKFVTVKNGYHGDTWHAMSVCDPNTGMHHIFNGKLTEQLFLPSPQSGFYDEFDANELTQVEDLLKAESSNLAAFILEPIVQGAGGMKFYHPKYLKAVRELCTKHNVLLIADEIATGFGRTGELFACNHANISPDIICIGKAMTGGYMSFAATVCTKEIAHCISNNSPGVFMHGPTYMANPLACAVSCKSIELLLNSDWKRTISRIETTLGEALNPLASLNSVKDVRVLGAIGVVEMCEPVDMAEIQQEFKNNGIWMRPFGRLVYTMPPFNISDEELTKLTAGIVNTIHKLYA